MGIPPESEPIELTTDERWRAIIDRAAAGKSTQADMDEALAECARLGRLALKWRELVQVWQEYADHLRKVMVATSREIKDEVDR